MPKGYADTVTCRKCGAGWPSDFAYCPDCGIQLPARVRFRFGIVSEIGKVISKPMPEKMRNLMEGL